MSNDDDKHDDGGGDHDEGGEYSGTRPKSIEGMTNVEQLRVLTLAGEWSGFTDLFIKPGTPDARKGGQWVAFYCGAMAMQSMIDLAGGEDVTEKDAVGAFQRIHDEIKEFLSDAKPIFDMARRARSGRRVTLN